MKKYIVFLVCLSVCISLLNITVFAEQEVDFNFEPQHPTGGIMLSEFQQTEDVSPAKSRLKVSLKTSPEIDFKTFLKEQLKNHETEISFQDYNITEKQLSVCLDDICFSDYSVMAYTGGQVWINEEGYVTTFKPRYILGSKEQDQNAIKMMSEKINSYVELADNVPDLAGKLLVIHDKFCDDNRYAYEAFEQNEEGKWVSKSNFTSQIFTAYGVFKDKRAVCQGNAIALSAIYQALNEKLKKEAGTTEDIVEVSLCASRKLNHAWNAVKINGEWYYIDETWDDQMAIYDEKSNPVNLYAGWNDPNIDNFTIINGVGHQYFLVPVNNMSDHLVKGDDSDSVDLWEYFPSKNVSCEDDKYTKGYVFNDIPFCVIGFNGKYVVTPLRSSFDFEMKSLKFDGIMCTAPFAYENSNAVIAYCAVNSDDENIAIDVYLDRDGYAVDMKPGLLKNGAMTLFQFSDVKHKIFIWQSGTMRPLCEVIEIN